MKCVSNRKKLTRFIFLQRNTIPKRKEGQEMGTTLMVRKNNKCSNASMAIAKAIMKEYQPQKYLSYPSFT